MSAGSRRFFVSVYWCGERRAGRRVGPVRGCWQLNERRRESGEGENRERGDGAVLREQFHGIFLSKEDCYVKVC